MWSLILWKTGRDQDDASQRVGRCVCLVGTACCGHALTLQVWRGPGTLYFWSAPRGCWCCWPPTTLEKPSPQDYPLRALQFSFSIFNGHRFKFQILSFPSLFLALHFEWGLFRAWVPLTLAVFPNFSLFLLRQALSCGTHDLRHGTWDLPWRTGTPAVAPGLRSWWTGVSVAPGHVGSEFPHQGWNVDTLHHKVDS